MTDGSREGRRPLVLLLVAVLGVFPLVQSRAAWLGLTGVSIASTFAAVRGRAWPAAHLGALASLLLATLSAFGDAKLWPLPPILAVTVYLVAAKRVAALGGLPRWFDRGRLDRATWLLIVMSVVVSSAALVAWFALAEPDYAELVARLPKLPASALFAGVFMFALVNAALEELIYRGVLLGALDASLGAGVSPVVIQALLFGVLHVNGFPRGPVGIGLATIYGLMMGVVRRRSGGLLAPWIAHVGADVAIGSILLTTIR